MREESKIRAYEARNPGVDIPPEQKAERVDRKIIQEKYRGSGRRAGKRTVGSIVVPRLWPGHPSNEEE